MRKIREKCDSKLAYWSSWDCRLARCELAAGHEGDHTDHKFFTWDDEEAFQGKVPL